MSQEKHGYDWCKSKAHLLLLTNFFNPRTADGFSGSDTWREALGEDPEQALKRFVDDEVLKQANLNGKLDYRYKVTELKSILKERGLPVSGRKESLINRLVQADPEGMESSVAGLIVIQCSERGREIAEHYLSVAKDERNKLEEHVIEYLNLHKYREASLTVAEYEAKQVFSRGMGMDWKNYNPTRDIAILNSIFNCRPTILSSLNEEQLTVLRLAAGINSLFGTNQDGKWLPQDLETGLAMDNDAAARMLRFHATHLLDIAHYHESGYIKEFRYCLHMTPVMPANKYQARGTIWMKYLNYPMSIATIKWVADVVLLRSFYK